MPQKLVYVNILDKMNNNYRKFMQKGGGVRYMKGGTPHKKKYQTTGQLGAMPYGQNVIPQGILPSQYITFSEGANQFSQTYQDELNQATEDIENFEPTAEQLGVVDPNENPVGTGFVDQLGSAQKLDDLGLIDLGEDDFKNVIAGEHSSLKDSKVGQFFQKTFKGKGDDIASDITSSTASTSFGDNLPSILGSEGSNTLGTNLANVTGTGTAPTFNMNMASSAVPSTGPVPGMHPGVDLIGQGTKSTGIQTIGMKPLETSTQSLMPPTSLASTIPKGVNLSQTAGIGTAAAIGGQLIKSASDDEDPTTLNVGETAGTLIGAGGQGASMAATLGMLAPALAVPGIGWVGAGIGALWGGLSALNKRRKAKKEEKKQEKELQIQEAYAAQKAGDASILASSYSGFDYGKNLKLGGTPYRY